MFNKESLIELTSNLYRLTLLFPKKEPLRYKIREKAIDILTKCLRANFEKEKNPLKYRDTAYADLEVLDSFFEVALIQNWVSPSDILAIKEKYDSLGKDLERIKTEKQESFVSEELFESEDLGNEITEEEAREETIDEPESKKEKTEIKPVKSEEDLNKLNDRQKKIIDFLTENGRAQVWQVKQIMPDITKRTLRRDFEYMLTKKLIERIGEKNDTFYQTKTNQA